MAEYGIGIWGAGWVAGEHARAYTNNPKARVVAVGSRTLEGARRRIEEWGIVGCRAYDDLEELLAHPELDVVSVCTPNYRHAADVVAIASAGKHILIEKPPATDLEGLRAMRDAVRQAGVKTLVGFVLHWHPLFQAVKRVVAGGLLGRVIMAQLDYWHRLTAEDQLPLYAWLVSREKAGSIFLAGGSHPMDAVRWFLGGEIEEVCGYSTEPSGDYDYPTTTVGLLRFRDGAIAKISACVEAYLPYTFNIDLLGEEGTLRDERVCSRKLGDGKEWVDLGVAAPHSGEVSAHPFQAEINYFLDCLDRGVDSEINLEDGVKTTEACLAVDMAAVSGRPVKLPLL
ncbi:MAG: Gfo/Idh/MocA family oxidoreductase [Anaerolineae bacterium]|nr:Gfo/Idh/MocA family oxidoreductase [Anaerolineae bacterium]